MASDARKQQIPDTTDDGVLAAQDAFPDVGSTIIVRRHEVVEVARSVGVCEEEAWRIFNALKGTAWEGQCVVKSRPEERGYTSARLTCVDPGRPKSRN